MQLKAGITRLHATINHEQMTEVAHTGAEKLSIYACTQAQMRTCSESPVVLLLLRTTQIKMSGRYDWLGTSPYLHAEAHHVGCITNLRQVIAGQ